MFIVFDRAAIYLLVGLGCAYVVDPSVAALLAALAVLFALRARFNTAA